MLTNYKIYRGVRSRHGFQFFAYNQLFQKYCKKLKTAAVVLCAEVVFQIVFCLNPAKYFSYFLSLNYYFFNCLS